MDKDLHRLYVGILKFKYHVVSHITTPGGTHVIRLEGRIPFSAACPDRDRFPETVITLKAREEDG